MSGPIMFARFAYPPNALGYCGPDEHDALLEYAATGGGEGGLRSLAARFDGAWPYLELIAAANAIGDPLDARVVEAYWIGNALLRTVTPSMLAASLETRFRSTAGHAWERLAPTSPDAVAPHHGFHVFAVYPWLGLLRSPAGVDALRVLDRCRIRWGTVVARERDTAIVESARLEWDGQSLALGTPQDERVTIARDGGQLASRCAPGDVVALHWDWLCERLDPRQAHWLQHCTAEQLRVVNALPASA